MPNWTWTKVWVRRINLLIYINLRHLDNIVQLLKFFISILVNDANDQDPGIEVEDGEIIDNSRKIGFFNATENSTAPKFTKLDSMHRVIAKPAGNMLKLKCVAEGKCQVFKPTKVLVV